MVLVMSESVASGHPDKLADQISDAILDAYLSKDKEAHVAVETMVTDGNVFVAGEVSTTDLLTLDIEGLVRSVIREVGYQENHFSWQNAKVTVMLQMQSQEISQSVSGEGGAINAGDQGIVVGYATNETEAFLPTPTYYAHLIMQSLCKIHGFGPDGKIQLNMREEGDHISLENLVVSIQHTEGYCYNALRDTVREVISEIFPYSLQEKNFLINPSGSFVIGGPKSDCGITGRKIMVDSYGASFPHGGGAFSGKDCTKIDRSGAYFARYLAKNIVAAGLANKCLIKMCYAIGRPDPLSVSVEADSEVLSNEELEALITSEIDLSLSSVIEMLHLKSPIYRKTSTYGHFGKVPFDIYFTWERLDLVSTFRRKAGCAIDSALRVPVPGGGGI